MTLRWGFLGASRIGRRALAPAIAAAPAHVLQGVAARDPLRAAAYATELAIPQVFDSYAALINADEIDAVYNALPNDLHAEWSIRAMEAGKHVLCEKPLTMNAAEAEAIAAAERRTGRRAMEAFCQIHHPQFARAQGLLARLGTPLTAHAYFGTMIVEPDDYRWLARHGGGALFDLGCYCVSTMRLLLGREPLRVSATQALRGDVDETFSGMLDFGEGLAGQFACSFTSAFTQHLEIIGTQGRMFMDWPISTKGRATKIVMGDATHDAETIHFEATDPYVAMVLHFAAAVTSGAEMLHDMRGAIHQARTLDALRAAATDGIVAELI